jgi:hypothetical protein
MSCPTQVVVFTSRKVKFSVKGPFARAIGHAIVVRIFFEKSKKRKEGIVPWVDPEQGAFLHGC